jgi:hypothetical protein
VPVRRFVIVKTVLAVDRSFQQGDRRVQVIDVIVNSTSILVVVVVVVGAVVAVVAVALGEEDARGEGRVGGAGQMDGHATEPCRLGRRSGDNQLHGRTESVELFCGGGRIR